MIRRLTLTYPKVLRAPVGSVAGEGLEVQAVMVVVAQFIAEVVRTVRTGILRRTVLMALLGQKAHPED
jgi:hypothetical protein